ncbi:MAG: ABC transporter ATP-binding protein [Clostridiales bacterium]|nr:ABC transporter ATP-binding protein [Clostridiales bacterium]
MENKNLLLSVKDLQVKYQSGGVLVHAVNGVSFDLEKGKTFGLVGETGAGKTSIARAILRILPDYATRVCSGETFFEGVDLMKLSATEMQKYRGGKISMIFQDPMTALNPVQTVVNQIAEGLKTHEKITKAEARLRAIEMLETVGIPADRADEYPHQFSGGMKQRVVIAIALACNPELLIADEQTTALDVTIQAQVMDLIKSLRAKRNTSMIMITHDLGVIADVCDYVAVVYAGQIVEYGTLEDIYDRTAHPYMKGLFAALPEMNLDSDRLKPIEGMPADPTNLPDGCKFAPRCPYATEECRKREIDLKEVSAGHFCRCIKTESGV